jgi:hypothetical protein
VIIHQTLYDLFPPTSIDPNKIAPLTPSEFLQQILVPEVGVRLIMEDQGLVGDDATKIAVQTLRDSASYGVSMFPEDGENPNKDDEELSVADLIVKERAKKRRKELQEEEEKEEKEWRLLEELEKQNTKASKKQDEEKSKKNKGKGKEVEPLPVSPPAPPPTSRPRPRPLGKSSSSASVFTQDLDEPGLSQAGAMVDEETDIEVDNTLRFKSRRPLGISPTINDFQIKTDDESSTRRVTRSASRSTSVDVNLCSSDEDTSHSGVASKAQPRKPNPKRTRIPKGTRDSKQTGSDSDVFIVDTVPSSPTTPVARRSKDGLHGDVDMKDTPMPSSRSDFPPSLLGGKSGAKVYPLQLAKQLKKARHAGESIK